MNVDEESDYEEEEFLIYADFKNQLGPFDSIENSTVKIIGLDGDPIAEVNGNVFKGTYDYPMGTCVFFEKDLDATPPDPLFESSYRQKYKYVAKTNKVINFERIFVEKKVGDSNQQESIVDVNEESQVKAGASDQENHKLSPDEDNLHINISYDDAIKLFPSHENTA